MVFLSDYLGVDGLLDTLSYSNAAGSQILSHLKSHSQDQVEETTLEKEGKTLNPGESSHVHMCVYIYTHTHIYIYIMYIHIYIYTHYVHIYIYIVYIYIYHVYVIHMCEYVMFIYI